MYIHVKPELKKRDIKKKNNKYIFSLPKSSKKCTVVKF
jgi:hypothetical protein